MSSAVTVRPDVLTPPSPEDDGNFRRSLQIDMKGLVGDAVGNMSISPGSRDIVLATRNGLFIIDLEAPLNVPRGTWDVADVQWNPHPSHSEYIVSTSSEKLLIWNLLLTGKTSIEHVLRSHYRAITDINWHTTDPDVVVSTGIDSWLWAWDLRSPLKPVMGLCAFGSGGTQVKWNRQDGNLLASSHQNEVLLWDRRKGSLPVSHIKAHTAKIYGIDWSHDSSTEIVTCSLDKSIKIWDTRSSEPKITIQTAYPVWRARDLPFGHGLLSLPQRGETTLEMYAYDDPYSPVELFEGHTDVVKEFVWRRGGRDYSEFQLITWSKDKTLRFWPVDTEVMQRAGTTTPTCTSTANVPRREPKVSFSNPLLGSHPAPALSAPVGSRAILAEVRAPFLLRKPKVNHNPRQTEIDTANSSSKDIVKDGSVAATRPIPIAQEKGSTMTRGHPGGKSAQITTIAWLSSVKVGARREGSSGPGSGAESGTLSRLNSRSRPPSDLDRSLPQPIAPLRRSAEAREKAEDDHRDGNSGQSLHEEITSVGNKLSASKVRLEHVDLKKRTCTFGLHGPWGDSTSVFIRVSFTFPRDYPQAAYPNGTPSVDLERNPLISMKSRAYMLRRLRTTREQQRPCLEKCLTFLLFGDEDQHIGRPMGIDSESSSDDEAPPVTRNRRGLSFSLLRNDKNLAEPRTSQGVFGVNGQLVCFFRAPPRIVKNPMREISVSPSVASRSVDTGSRLFQSPALLSDAVRRLGYAARDRDIESMELIQAEDANNILRIMTNLFIFTQQKPRRISEHSRTFEDVPNSYALLSTRRSSVFIKDTSALVGIDIGAAQDYLLIARDPADICKDNAQIARARGRVDHERVFKMLEAVLVNDKQSDVEAHELNNVAQTRDVLVLRVISDLYREMSVNKDIQMLAILSVLLLRTSSLLVLASHKTPDFGTPDSRGPLNHRDLSLSPIWSRASFSLPFQPVAPALSSPSSSRGSWSSLFNTSSMRHFVAGPKPRMAITIPEGVRMDRGFSAHRGRDILTQPIPPVPKSWSEATSLPPIESAVTFSSAGHVRRPTFSQILSSHSLPHEKRRVVVNLSLPVPPSITSLQAQLRDQLLCHVFSYAEMLLAWGLPQKRSELLKAVEKEIHSTPMNASIIEHMIGPDCIGSISICEHRVPDSESAAGLCAACAGRAPPLRCSVCRLPVKGLSHCCLICLHVTHIVCWEGMHGILCPTGCGCRCAQSTENALIAGGAGDKPLSPLPM